MLNRREFIAGAVAAATVATVATPAVGAPSINTNRKGPLWGSNGPDHWGPLGLNWRYEGDPRTYWRDCETGEWVAMVWLPGRYRWSWLTHAELDANPYLAG